MSDGVYISGSAKVFCLNLGMNDSADIAQTHYEIDVDVLEGGVDAAGDTEIMMYSIGGASGKTFVHTNGGEIVAFLPDDTYYFTKDSDAKRTQYYTVAGHDKGYSTLYFRDVVNVSGDYTLGQDDLHLHVADTATITSPGHIGAGVEISCAPGASLTIDDLSIDNISLGGNPIAFAGAGNTLTLMGESDLTAEDYLPAIAVEGAAALTIGGSGKLIATGGDESAGIGSADWTNLGSLTIEGGIITINGGTVVATGGEDGAGIGYGYGGGEDDESGTTDDNLVINIGGTADVTATGGYEGAGIGYGDYSDDGPMTINISGSAVVTATGGDDAAGIGSSDDEEDSGCENSVINISGGWVYAIGDEYGAGIGTGDDQGWGTINITGGVVNAYGGYEDDIGEGGESVEDGVYISGDAMIFCLNFGMYDSADLGTHRHVEIDLYEDGNPVPGYTRVELYGDSGYLGDAIVHDDGGYLDAYLPAGTYWFEKDGKKTETVTVTDADIDTRLDFVEVRLSDLTVNSGSLAPDFDSDEFDYTVIVDNAVASIMLTPTAIDAGDSITVDGAAVVSGSASQAIDLTVGDTVIEVVVTDETATTVTETYTVTVTRVSGRLVNVGGTVEDDGAAQEGFTVIIQSDPKTVVTDSDGEFSFSDVELGRHKLIIKNTSGTELRTFNLTITEGSAFSWNQSGDDINIVLGDGTVLVDISIEVNEETAAIENIDGIDNPDTGGGSGYAWLALCLGAVLMLAAAGVKKAVVR